MNLHEALQDFLRSKTVANRSERTVKWHGVEISIWLKWLEQNGADWLSPDDLEAFLEYERGRGLSDHTIDGHWRALRGFFNWIKKRRPAMLAGQTPPIEFLERAPVHPKKPRQADYDDMLRLIASLRITARSWFDYRDWALIQLLLSTGLRINEACSLRLEHVELRDRFVYVAAGKGDRDRNVPFDEAFAKAFTGYVFNRPVVHSDWLFLAADGHRQALPTNLKPSAARYVLARRCANINIPYINAHSIRHLFAMKALNEGMQLSAVSAILGHSSVAFTARVYAKWVKRGLRREYDASWQAPGGRSAGATVMRDA